MIDLKNTLLLGHRGARGEALENTLSGFEYAQNLQSSGLAGVEFDVQLSRDGQLIVFHDETLERMCAQQSRLDQINVSKIQRHHQFGKPIITLLDIASALNTYTYIELEVKTHSRTDYAKLVKALMRDLIDSPLANLPIVLTSFDVELHARLQRSTFMRHIPRGLLIREPELLKQAPNTALQLGCKQLGIHYPLLNREVIQYCHRYDLPVSAWTVNDIETIKQLINWQVDVIITDYPSYLLLP